MTILINKEWLSWQEEVGSKFHTVVTFTSENTVAVYKSVHRQQAPVSV